MASQCYHDPIFQHSEFFFSGIDRPALDDDFKYKFDQPKLQIISARARQSQKLTKNPAK